MSNMPEIHSDVPWIDSDSDSDFSIDYPISVVEVSSDSDSDSDIEISPAPRLLINSSLPVELLREIFLYCIEVNEMKSIQLASVCRQWRAVITTMSRLWSTLRVGSWTEREQVSTWLQRAYPKKVILDTQRDDQIQSNTEKFAAFQDVFTYTDQWHELTISSFPPDRPDNLANQFGFQIANPMKVLRVLHVAAGCLNTQYFADLLDLIPTDAPISEMRLHSTFSVTYFLQPHWFPALQKLTVLIVNGRAVHEPFGLLPAFTQLQRFEGDHLPLPWYEPDIKLPLLCTLQKLRLKGSSVQWMAGREFPCIEDCTILFPRHWMELQRHGVQLPSCMTLAYHGHPMTTVQYFHVPQMKVLGLGSNDCKEQRVYQHLHHLCTLDQTFFKLTALHLTLQCSEQVFVKMLKYLGPLQELILSIVHPSLSWQGFLGSLAAQSSTKDWPQWVQWDQWDRLGPWFELNQWDQWDQWDQWCSSQTWHTNILTHLKYLGIQCPKGFSQSECLESCTLFRLVGWTRAQLSLPLEHLKVWEGRGTTEDIPVDYISSSYMKKHLGTLDERYDSTIIRGMVTQTLAIHDMNPPFMHQIHFTILFRQLRVLFISVNSNNEIWILPDLEQIKWLKIQHGIIPEYSLDFTLPLVNTLQRLCIEFSSISWMIGRSFKVLEEFTFFDITMAPVNVSVHNGLQIDIPVCRRLACTGIYDATYRLFSCPNVQSLYLMQAIPRTCSLRPATKSLSDQLLNSSCLQELTIIFFHCFGLEPLIQSIFCNSWEQGAWKDIRSVEFRCSGDTENQFFNQMVGRQQHYEERWKEFVVCKYRDGVDSIALRALA